MKICKTSWKCTQDKCMENIRQSALLWLLALQPTTESCGPARHTIIALVGVGKND